MGIAQQIAESRLEKNQDLTALDGGRKVPACFTEMRAKLGARATSESIYNEMSLKDKGIVLFAAGGFSKDDIKKEFRSFDKEQRSKIHSAIMHFGGLHKLFKDAHVLMHSQFVSVKPTLSKG